MLRFHPFCSNATFLLNGEPAGSYKYKILRNALTLTSWRSQRSGDKKLN
jgi:hypothetical protein